MSTETVEQMYGISNDSRPPRLVGNMFLGPEQGALIMEENDRPFYGFGWMHVVAISGVLLFGAFVESRIITAWLIGVVTDSTMKIIFVLPLVMVVVSIAAISLQPWWANRQSNQDEIYGDDDEDVFEEYNDEYGVGPFVVHELYDGLDPVRNN